MTADLRYVATGYWISGYCVGDTGVDLDAPYDGRAWFVNPERRTYVVRLESDMVASPGFKIDANGPYLTKDPDATLDYVFDWTYWLNGDTIDTASISVSSEATKVDETSDDTTARVWVRGGAAGDVITVICEVTTAAGRTDERTIRLKVADR